MSTEKHKFGVGIIIYAIYVGWIGVSAKRIDDVVTVVSSGFTRTKTGTGARGPNPEQRLGLLWSFWSSGGLVSWLMCLPASGPWSPSSPLI